jgi:hypothetical protein
MKITITNPLSRPQYLNGRSRQTKSRLYINTKNETILENLANRRSRPTQVYKSILPDIFQALGVPVKPVRWSQYAGCTCPCSPGFIIEGDYGMDYWITVEMKNE